jgi:AcrR family transcriptional regulator
MEAAIEEFSASGIAGARVDRIAETAGCNKAMIYAYYGNKDQLFDAVYTHYVAIAFEAVKFDPTNLDTYAGQLFDCYEGAPALLRLATWYQLERPDGVPLKARVASNQVKIDGVAKAQADGLVTTRYTPAEVLSLIRSIATAWSPIANLASPEAASIPKERQRELVVESAKRLLAPD